MMGDAGIIVALIAAFTSLVVAMATQLFTYRSQRQLEELRNTFARQKSQSDARLDYEYEARKRLYQEYEPLLFQLVDFSDSALGRIRNLASAASRGDLGLEPSDNGWLSPGARFDDYYLLSTIYRLLAPLAVLALIQRKLTLVDLSLDESINAQYLLAKGLHESFTDDFKIAKQLLARGSGRDYSPLAPEARTERQSDPARYWRQGVPVGRLDNAVEALIRSDPSTGGSVMTYGMFESAYHQGEERFIDTFAPVRDLFLHFHPAKRPILWCVLLAQAHFHTALMKLRSHQSLASSGDAQSRPNDPVGVLMKLAELDEPSDFDWRPVSLRTPGAHHEHDVPALQVAREYVRRELTGSSGKRSDLPVSG